MKLNSFSVVFFCFILTFADSDLSELWFQVFVVSYFSKVELVMT